MTIIDTKSRMLLVARRFEDGSASETEMHAITGIEQAITVGPAATDRFMLRAFLQHIGRIGDIAKSGHWVSSVAQPRPSACAWYIDDASITEIDFAV